MDMTYELSNEQLNDVAGGRGSLKPRRPVIRIEGEYHRTGIETDWSGLKRKFYFMGKQISENEAAAMAFCRYCGYNVGSGDGDSIIAKARAFKEDNVEAYREYLSNVNARA